MQVTLDKQYPIAASVDTAWRILANIPELTTCMPGAQITERIDDSHYRGSVKVKVGPAVAAFAGDIEVLNMDAAARTLRMLGKGADKGGSSASMELTATLAPAADGASTLQGRAEVIVNGKFAQFGGRMMNSVSDMILAQFAKSFSDKAQALDAASAALSPSSAAQSAATVQSTAAAPHSAAAVQSAAVGELNALSLLWGVVRRWFGRKA